jgi:hypothetical protein
VVNQASPPLPCHPLCIPAVYWTDEDAALPFRYTFRYRRGSVAQILALDTASTAIGPLPLPPGPSPSNALTLEVRGAERRTKL